MKTITTVLLMAVLLLPACKVVKYTPEKWPDRRLLWGQGGGFTGVETTYTLLPNGQIFVKKGVEAGWQELKSVKKKTAAKYFETAASLQLYKLDIDKPGNMYYFVHEITPATDSKCIWGAGDYLPPEGLVALYRELTELVKDRAPAKNTSNPSSGQQKPVESNDPTKW